MEFWIPGLRPGPEFTSGSGDGTLTWRIELDCDQDVGDVWLHRLSRHSIRDTSG